MPSLRTPRGAVAHRSGDTPGRRYFVGGLGKILITTGLLMFGFVAYQLWGTGIETARAQNHLESQFETQVASTVTTHRPHRDPCEIACGEDNIETPSDTYRPYVETDGLSVESRERSTRSGAVERA